MRLAVDSSIGPTPSFVVPFLAILVGTWLAGPAVGLGAVAVVALVDLGIIQRGTTGLDRALAEVGLAFELVNGLLAVVLGIVIRTILVRERRSRATADRASRVARGAEERLLALQDSIEELDRASSALQAADHLARAAQALTGAQAAAVHVRGPGEGVIRLAHAGRGATTSDSPATGRPPPPPSEAVEAAIQTGRPATDDSSFAVPLLRSADRALGAIELIGAKQAGDGLSDEPPAGASVASQDGTSSTLETSANGSALAAVLALGRLGGAALERLRLRDEQRLTTAAASRSADRVARLERLTAALASAVTVDDVGRELVAHATAALNVPVAGFYLAGPSGDLDLVHQRGFPGGIARRDTRLRRTAPVPAAEAIRLGRVVVIESPEAWRRQYTGATDVLAMTGTRSVVAVPIAGADGPSGALVILRSMEGAPTDDDLGLLLVATQQAAAALERARLYAEEREALRVQEAFIGVISHELRTPITTILAGSKLLGRDRGMTPLGRELADDVASEADRLFRLVEDLLVLSRLERGQLPVGEEPVHLTRVLERVVASESARWPQARFELPSERIVLLARGEETYVEQVVRNLLANAAKYGPPGGTVRVRLDRERDGIAVRILDEGPGILDEEASQLFDLYYRSPATAGIASGAGIGLYVCRRLVAAMGGRIWAQRRDGGGSEFGFLLEEYPLDDEAGTDGLVLPGHAAGLDGTGETIGAGAPADGNRRQ